MSNDMDLILRLSALDNMSKVIRGAVNASDDEFDKLQKKIQGTAQRFDDIGKTALIAGGAIAAPLVIGVNKAADFEQEMSNIKAVTGATTAEMQKMNALALKMGADTKYSALESAQGIEELLKAGLTTQQVLNGGLAGALSLAAAGGISVAESAEIASTALNAFRADGLSVAKAADILSGAANASATDVAELKYSLSACASVASGVGMTFRDTSTALALFAQNGLKGSDAGTSLKSMLMNLQPRTDAQVAAFVKLGLATGKLVKVSKDGKEKYQLLSNAFFDSHGKLKDLTQITGLLHEKMKGLTDQQRMFALETMFGSDAIRAANILFKEGAKGTNAMWLAMSKVTAAQVSKTKMDNLNGSIENMTGSIDTAAISYSNNLIPAINAITKGVTVATNAFNAMPEPIKAVMAIGSALTAVSLIGLGGISLAAGAATRAYGQFLEINRMAIPKLEKMGVALKAGMLSFADMSKNGITSLLKTLPAMIGLTDLSTASFIAQAAAIQLTPIGWIAAGVALIAGAALLVVKYWKPIAGFFKGVWSGIVEGTKPLHPLFAKIAGAVKPLIDGFKKILKPVNDTNNAAQNFGKTVGKVIGEGITLVAKFIKALMGLSAKFGPILGPLAAMFKAGKATINVIQSSAGKAAQGNPKVNGSHANGLTSVPYNGYVAELHKNERVLTASENKQLKSGSFGGGNISLVYSPQFSTDAIKDTKDLKKILQEHTQEIKRVLKEEQRRQEARAYAS